MTYVGATPTTGDFKILDSITTSSATTFNLRQGGVAVYPQSANHCLVVLNGVLQTAGSSFNIVNDTIVFASSLASSDVINQILVLGNVNDIGVPSDDTVSTAKIQADAINATKIADDSISDEHLDITAITGQTAITSLADTDKFLVSDASDSGNLKYVEKQYLPSGGLAHLNTTTGSSNVSIVSVDNIFSATYENYFVIFELTFDTTGADPHFNFRDSTPQNLAASVYTQAVNGLSSDNGAVSIYNSSNDTKIQVGHGMYNQSSIDMPAMTGFCYILDPVGTSTTTNILWNYGQRASNGLHRGFQGASLFNNKTSVRGFSWTASSGNVHNYTIRTYGIVNS